MSPSLLGARVALVICGAVVALDQASKAFVNSEVARGDRVELLPFLALQNVRNKGIAFGLADGTSTVVIAVAVAVVLGLLAFLVLQVHGRGVWIAGGLLLGGALGNLADRIRDGAVIDFIDLPAWPTFNLADVAITAGVVLLLVTHREDGGEGKPATSDD